MLIADMLVTNSRPWSSGRSHQHQQESQEGGAQGGTGDTDLILPHTQAHGETRCLLSPILSLDFAR